MLEDAVESRVAAQAASTAAAAPPAPRRFPRSCLSAGDRLQILAGLLRAGDFAAAPAGAAIAYGTRYANFELAPRDWLIVLVATLLNSCCLHMLRTYDHDVLRSWGRQLPRVSAAWTVTILLVISLMYFAKIGDVFSRTWLALWGTGSLVLLLGVRLTGVAVLAHWQRHGRLARSVALIGATPPALGKAAWLSQSRELKVIISDLYSPEVLGEIVAAARCGKIEEIIIAATGNSWQPTEDILARFSGIAVSIKLYHDAFDLAFLPRKVEVLAGRALFGISERPLAGWRQIAKRAEDIVLSTLLIALTLPLMLLIGIAVRLDTPGPVLFRQKRFGFNGELIEICKFRSMHDRTEPDHGLVQARRNDVRVTRLGAVLRRLSFDELPQLFNVLRGEMSLVGPRPHPVALDERFAKIIDGYLARHRVKPGITGWAQINGLRGETDTAEKMQRRIQHDLYYIENWSLLFDLKILLITAFIALVDENAY